jgi:hypothetical protein
VQEMLPTDLQYELHYISKVITKFDMKSQMQLNDKFLDQSMVCILVYIILNKTYLMLCQSTSILLY